MKAIWTIARRELRSMFDHPMGYILLVVFIVVNDFLFFRQAFLFGVATLRPMLELLPWLMLFFVPAVTMRALAEDIRAGTLEVVLAQPISELQLLLGKYVGQLLFVWLALALTLPIPIGFSFGADLAAGVMVAQYVGAAMLAAAYTAIGVWASSLGRNQVTAFIVGVAVMFALLLIGLGPVTMSLPPELAGVVANIGVLTHFTSIARGVIDLRDVVYFLSVTAIFLVLAYGSLMGRKLAPGGASLARLRLGTLLMTITLVVVNLFGRHIGGRLDLTPGKAYTLSPATKAILGNLPDLVTIRLFVSSELPPEVSMLRRDVDDLLSDFRAAGDGMVRLVVQDPTGNEELEEEARSFGVPPVQFNVARKSEFQIKEGYLGLAVQYADESESIPVIQRSDDLEYRLASFVWSLIRPDTPAIGFYEAPLKPGQQQGPTYSALEGVLRETYDVHRVDIETDSLNPDELSALVLAGTPTYLPDSTLDKLKDYFARGGGGLVMARGMELSTMQNQPISMERPVALNRALEAYGVRVRGDMLFDLSSNEPVSMRASFGNVMVNYPFWLRALSTQASNVNREIGTVFLPWASSIDTTGARPGTITPLFVTSQNAGVEEQTAFLSTQRKDYPRDNLGSRLVAVQVNPGEATDAESSDSAGPAPSGRLIVVSSDDFASDQWARGASQNIAFALNAVDWLAQEEGLIAIRAKDRTPPPLVFEGESTGDLIQYGNIIGVPLLLVLLGAIRLWRRRRRSRQPYRPTGQLEAA